MGGGRGRRGGNRGLGGDKGPNYPVEREPWSLQWNAGGKRMAYSTRIIKPIITRDEALYEYSVQCTLYNVHTRNIEKVLLEE